MSMQGHSHGAPFEASVDLIISSVPRLAVPELWSLMGGQDQGVGNGVRQGVLHRK